MNAQFITLPSRLRVNASHILSYREVFGATKQTVEIEILGSPSFHEDMTAEQLDNLLQPSSPIVSPVVELRLPKVGEPVMFLWDGHQKHGIVTDHNEDDQKVVVSSHGVDFQYDLPTGYIIDLS